MTSMAPLHSSTTDQVVSYGYQSVRTSTLSSSAWEATMLQSSSSRERPIFVVMVRNNTERQIQKNCEVSCKKPFDDSCYLWMTRIAVLEVLVEVRGCPLVCNDLQSEETYVFFYHDIFQNSYKIQLFMARDTIDMCERTARTGGPTTWCGYICRQFQKIRHH